MATNSAGGHSIVDLPRVDLARASRNGRGQVRDGWPSEMKATDSMQRITDLFVSHFTQRLDAKGRVSIPASFRTILNRDQTGTLFCCRSLDCETIDAGGAGLIAEIEQLIAAHAESREASAHFATALYGACETLKIDSEGRVALSPSLKAHACIADQITFVGLGRKFQLWEPSRFRAHMANAAWSLRQATASVRTMPRDAFAVETPE